MARDRESRKVGRTATGKHWQAVVAAAVIAAVVPAGSASGQPRHPRWPVVNVPGVRPMAISRRGVRIVQPAQARADRIIVILRRGMRVQSRQELAAMLGRPVARYWKRLGMASVVVRPERIWQELGVLKAHPAVEKAEPDYIVYPAYVPDTPEYRKQYHHSLIRTPEAWDVKSASEWPAVVIAMVDTGVDLDHPDLQGKIWVNADEVPGNGRDDDHNGFVDDVHGWDFYNDNNDPNPEPDGRDENGDGEADEQVSHGTLGAGLAGAAVFDDWGTAGVYPNARIMAIQVFPDDGGTDYQTVVDGIEYAIDNGAEVINLSIGAPWSDVFTPPITRAHDNGIVVVSAAGNYQDELTDTYWQSPVCNDGPNPLQYNYVIGVAYTDANDRKGTYTNYDGSTPRHFVDVSAPGDNIYGPAYYDPSVPGFDSYFYYNTGTSFAAPMVSGLAAMLRALHPSWSPDDITERIRETADNIDRLNPGYAGKLGTGRINCARAVGVALPPRPPSNVQAYDTPHDNGGSITVSWDLSPDDGAGMESVVGYSILRREGASGSFTQVAQVDAGVDHYEDTDVVDGHEYYYKVGATDGTLTGFSDVVGPAVPKDDLAPPPVTCLHAADQPADQGGAIVLDWSDYDPPADCVGYRIYRDRWPFDRIGVRQPIATIDDPRIKRYVDGSVLDYTDYYYAVTAVDDAGNEDKNVSAVGPVQSIPNGTLTVPAGLHMFAAPAVPASGDPCDMFGNEGLICAGWDTDARHYVIYRPGDPLVDAVKLRLGKGLWVALRRSVEIQIAGQTASSGDFAVDLTRGWHLLGNPYFSDVDFSQCLVQDGSTVYDLMSAADLGYLAAAAFIYDRDRLSYKMLAADWTGTALIPAWQGFWVRIYRECRFIIVRPIGSAQTQAAGGGKTLAVAAAAVRQQHGLAPVAKRRSAGRRIRWRLQVAAIGKKGADRENFVGVAQARVLRVPEPPAAVDGPALWIDYGGERNAAVGLRPARRMKWEIVVEPAPGERVVAVEFVGVDGVPEDYAIMLRDRDGGRTYDVRRHRRIEFVGTSARHLELLCEISARRTLAVQSMSVRPAGRGAQVVFTLSAPAYCDVEIMNIAGRRVRRVRSAALMPAGRNVVTWDGRGDAGTLVPAGRYLVRLRARAEDGSIVQALRAVTVSR